MRRLLFCDFLIFILYVIIFQTGRLALVIAYSGLEMPDEDLLLHISIESIYLCLRFDIMVATYFALVSVISTLCFVIIKNKRILRLKIYYNTLSTVIIFIICISNFYFFKEYHTQFNYWIFGIINDQPMSILSVIFKNYPCLKILISVLAIGYFAYLINKRLFTNIEPTDEKIQLKIIYILFSILLLICGLRGGQLWGKIVSSAMVATSSNPFVCNIIPNPAYLIKLEVSRYFGTDYLKTYNADKRELYNYSKSVFGSNERNLDIILTKTVKNENTEKPKQIFLIIGESHSSWGLNQKYTNGSQLMPNTEHYIENYPACSKAVSVAQSTFETVSSLLFGFPQVSAPKHKISLKATDKYMPGKYLSNLGWNTNFFYAGKSSWNYIGDVVEFCGFNMIGGEIIGNSYGSREWGMCDADLFNYILKQNFSPNTFNIILTVSNHEPFDIDFSKEGLHRDFDGEIDKKIWHHWYADKQIKIFVDKIMEKYPDSLIIITGDHPARVFYPNVVIDAEAKACVPIIFVSNLKMPFYSRTIKSASHLDIFPTVFDLIANKNFSYCAWGDSLLHKKDNMPFNDSYVNFNDKFYSITSSQLPDAQKEIIRKMQALAVWRLFNKTGIYPAE